MNIYAYFTDAVLRAPTIGCMLMCLAAALVGVMIFLRKQSLLGESLSHAAYPGVIIGIIIAGSLALEDNSEIAVALLIKTGAFITALTGFWAIMILENKFNVRSDSALCFVLSTFFGIGLTLASHVQLAYSSLYRQIQIYLYGQAATMTDVHILVYAVLCLLIIAMTAFLYKELQTMTFDRDFAKSIGIHTKTIDTCVFILVALAVVIGIRSVGVVLMSAMLVIPPAAARQFTNRMSMMFVLSGIVGMTSGFLGNYFSVEGSHYISHLYPDTRLSLPTGPMIVLVASTICVMSLLFAPERGLLRRLLRIAYFRYQCTCENLLKGLWRHGPDKTMTFKQIHKFHSVSKLYLHFILMRLSANGWLASPKPHTYVLTIDGRQWAAQIVRLHRLWEVYLSDYLGVGAERVHRNAEEMEHIITPDLERELTLLLKDPKVDPHHQPIPPKE